MSGRPKQNVQPTLLPSSGSYRAIYRYGAKPTRSTGERSARLRHVGREAARDESAGQRGRIYARIRGATEMEASAAMNQAPLHSCPERFWYRSLLRRNSEGSSPITTSAVSRRTCLPLSLPYGKSILFSRNPFFSYRLISFI